MGIARREPILHSTFCIPHYLLPTSNPRPDDPMARQVTISSVTTHPGFYSRDEVLDRYIERTGTDLSRITFYEVFALYKLCVVLEQIYCRYVRGQTRDERFAMFEVAVPTLARAAADLAEHSGL